MSNKPANTAKPANATKSGTPPKSKSAELAAAANQRRRDELEQRRKQAQQQQRNILLIGAVALLVVVVVGIFLLTRPPEATFPPDPVVAYSGIPTGTTQSGPNTSIQYPIALPYLGNPNAPVKIEEISSFSCPFCLQYHDNTFNSITDEIKAGRAQFIYIFTTNTGDYDSHPGTYAAVCAMQQNQFWPMHDILFYWQKTYAAGAADRARLELAAQHIGLDMGKFDSCMTDPATARYVNDSNDYANKRGLVGTPSVFIFDNGQQIQPPASASSSGQTPGSYASMPLGNLRGLMEASVPTNSAPATAAATAAPTSAATKAASTAATAAPTAAATKSS